MTAFWPASYLYDAETGEYLGWDEDKGQPLVVSQAEVEAAVVDEVGPSNGGEPRAR